MSRRRAATVLRRGRDGLPGLLERAGRWSGRLGYVLATVADRLDPPETATAPVVWAVFEDVPEGMPAEATWLCWPDDPRVVPPQRHDWIGQLADGSIVTATWQHIGGNRYQRVAYAVVRSSS